MRDSPLVSVLMTVYNREAFIADAIESVLSSSYQNFELIIVDDKSMDSSVGIAKKYEKKDTRIKVHVNEQNLGQFHNRNKAASLASGKYLKYLDSDDIIYPHGLEVMVNAMEKFPEVAFAMPGKPNENKAFPILCDGKEGYRKHFIEGGYFIFGPSAIIYRKDCFFNVNGFGDNNYVGNDEIVLVKLAAKYNYLLINPSLIWWRSHENQEMKRGIASNEYIKKGFAINYSHIINKDSPLSDKEKKIAIKKIRNLNIKRAIKLFMHFKIPEAVNHFLLIIKIIYN